MGVFISHITPEASLAAVLKKWIEDAFLGQADVFVSSDHDDITAGDQWFLKIGQALVDAKVLLVICSTESVHRPWINFETGAGHIKEVPIIPICHTGMTKQELPKPLLFFQALDAEENDFGSKLMAALTKHLDFPREPRIPYQEMKDDVKGALSQIDQYSEYSSRVQEMGFLDHLIQMQERIGELTKTLTIYGEDAVGLTAEMQGFIDQIRKARTDRYRRKVAKRFAATVEQYAEKTENLSIDYEKALPEAELSLRYVLGFQEPDTEDDWNAIEDLMGSPGFCRTGILGMEKISP